MNDLKKFRQMVDDHDITYHMSDDHLAYQAGHESYTSICKLARELVTAGVPPEHVITIWNDSVSERLTEEAAQQFVWRGMP